MKLRLARSLQLVDPSPIGIGNRDTGGLKNKHSVDKDNVLDPTIPLPVFFSYVRLSVTEGKYRMVRRILHNAGHSVMSLHRVRYGQVYLRELEEGEVRFCTSEEARWARALTSKT